MLGTSIAQSGVKVLSAWVGQICNLAVAHKILSVKLRDALIVGINELDTHSGSCTTQQYD